MRKRRRGKRELRTRSSQGEIAGPSGVSLLFLCIGASVCCGAVIFAYVGSDISVQRAQFATSTDAEVRVVKPEGEYIEHAHRFDACGRIRFTCVVDGDTMWLNGEKVRIADIDTPEISKPNCAREYELGVRAKVRLIELLNSGKFSVVASNSGDEDKYGRKLRMLFRNGRSIGDELVEEGLAHRWQGRRLPWC